VSKSPRDCLKNAHDAIDEWLDADNHEEVDWLEMAYFWSQIAQAEALTSIARSLEIIAQGKKES